MRVDSDNAYVRHSPRTGSDLEIHMDCPDIQDQRASLLRGALFLTASIHTHGGCAALAAVLHDDHAPRARYAQTQKIGRMIYALTVSTARAHTGVGVHLCVNRDRNAPAVRRMHMNGDRDGDYCRRFRTFQRNKGLRQLPRNARCTGGSAPGAAGARTTVRARTAHVANSRKLR